jgi:hypothetical protein
MMSARQMNIGETFVMQRRFGAWIRYGDPLLPGQVEFAIQHYATAILQPWEHEAAAALKRARPDMTVLVYKCLSSTRSYEPGPYYTSGWSYPEAIAAGEHLFAHRADGFSRIEWKNYPRHWQMAVWEPQYRERWIMNVVDELRGSVWDGVMADNDVYDDYYALQFPLAGGKELEDVRGALDTQVVDAGRALNGIGKILVPNIAESRREPGRWQRHAAHGGGYEEVWLAWEPDQHLDTADVLAQMDCLRGPGICIVRIATDGTDEHPNVLYGLAAFWVFGAGRNGTSFTATGHDQYSGTPTIDALDWDLGDPLTGIEQHDHVRHREFTFGWAATHIGPVNGPSVTVDVPAGLVDEAGHPAPAVITLAPRRGVLLRRA